MRTLARKRASAVQGKLARCTAASAGAAARRVRDAIEGGEQSERRTVERADLHVLPDPAPRRRRAAPPPPEPGRSSRLKNPSGVVVSTISTGAPRRALGNDVAERPSRSARAPVPPLVTIEIVKPGGRPPRNVKVHNADALSAATGPGPSWSREASAASGQSHRLTWRH